MNLINNKTIEKNKKYYTNEDTEFKFLLGGIGTGSISIGNRGQICDWEIFNSPNKNVIYPYSFFSLFSKFENQKEGEVRILESEINNPHRRPVGYASYELAGIPRFEKARLCGYGPFVDVDLYDKDLLLDVKMTAFSPLIPTDENNSGIPGVVFKYTITNNNSVASDVSICYSQSNFTAQEGFDLFGNMIINKELLNEAFYNDKNRGIKFSALDVKEEDLKYGTMCISTTNKNYIIKENWLEGGWWDGAHDFFNEFSKCGKISSSSSNNNNDKGRLEFISKLKTGSICVSEKILSHETKEFEFILSWHFPNRPKAWKGHICKPGKHENEIIKNYYAYKFKDAYDVTKYILEKYNYLYDYSMKFTNALFSTTIDKEFIDAINGTLTVLRSTTCFRVGKDGKFLCWEGCFDDRGSCEGNCTHVWNYAQTLAFLFPRLEQDMRKTEFLIETDDSGNMAFRTMQIFDDEKWDMLPATDGQMGCVLRLYRDWKFSGNDELLKECYPKMKKALDFAFDYWDSNNDCVLDSRQHNTYDIEFYGENSLSNSIFFAALIAGSKMASYLNDTETEKRWLSSFAKGSKLMDEKLYFNGYYIQDIDDVNKYKYQYGKGCLSDQVFGQTLAHLYNLGYILPKDHIKSAIKNVYNSNYRSSFHKHLNVQRTYALNDDEGLLVCGWKNIEDRPRIPFVYADEVWSGIEYQVATCLIYEGFLKEATDIVHSVRKRYDGKKRNPFNEVECGNHYARSLASYGLLIALSGYEFDLVNHTISFNPRVNQDNFTTFFTTANSFGLCNIIKRNGKVEKTVQVLFGDLTGVTVK